MVGNACTQTAGHTDQRSQAARKQGAGIPGSVLQGYGGIRRRDDGRSWKFSGASDGGGDTVSTLCRLAGSSSGADRLYVDARKSRCVKRYTKSGQRAHAW